MSFIISRFFCFSKNAFFNTEYSSSEQAVLQEGSNAPVTSKHFLILSHGYSLHCPQFSIFLSVVQCTIPYLHELSLVHPIQEISSFVTTRSLYPIFIQSSAVRLNSSSVFGTCLGHEEQSFPHAEIILSIKTPTKKIISTIIF